MNEHISERVTDVLVIGGGAAGQMAALAAAKKGCRVLIISDGGLASTGILGFCALVSDKDSEERFFNDMWNGGKQIGKPELVRTFVKGTQTAVHQLEELGMKFDRREDGSYHLLQPLGCSVPRLVHAGNRTGSVSLELLRTALRENGVEFLQGVSAYRVRTENGCAVGAWAFDKAGKKLVRIRAKAVVMASGGGHFMKNSTYPLNQYGDGYAMAYRAGAVLRDMEFCQHEPCRAVWPKPLGISTTLLAKGGILTNSLGERFVLRYYPTEGAAPKDALAKIVCREIKEGRGTEHGGVWLDLTGLPEDEIKINHSLYYERFINEGIDLTRERVEVGPAAHSMMGGIEVEPDCSCAVPGLFASGEVMGGLHGANRLGGNAGAEVYVFGSISGESAGSYACTAADTDTADDDPGIEINWDAEPEDDECAETVAAIREKLGRALAPIRSETELQEALEFIRVCSEKLSGKGAVSFETAVKLCPARNLCLLGSLMLQAALARKESRGVHSRSEYPETDADFSGRSIRFSAANGMQLSDGEA